MELLVAPRVDEEDMTWVPYGGCHCPRSETVGGKKTNFRLDCVTHCDEEEQRIPLTFWALLLKSLVVWKQKRLTGIVDWAYYSLIVRRSLVI